jgi:hypothetical protein
MYTHKLLNVLEKQYLYSIVSRLSSIAPPYSLLEIQDAPSSQHTQDKLVSGGCGRINFRFLIEDEF